MPSYQTLFQRRKLMEPYYRWKQQASLLPVHKHNIEACRRNLARDSRDDNVIVSCVQQY
jgi:hypothetical protein